MNIYFDKAWKRREYEATIADMPTIQQRVEEQGNVLEKVFLTPIPKRIREPKDGYVKPLNWTKRQRRALELWRKEHGIGSGSVSRINGIVRAA